MKFSPQLLKKGRRGGRSWVWKSKSAEGNGGKPRDAFLVDQRNVGWIDARLATGGWFCRWCCVRARTFVRHSRSSALPPLPPLFFPSHLVLSLLSSPPRLLLLLFLFSGYSCAARGGTILLRAVSPVNRYFRGERSRINLSGVRHKRLTALFAT